MDAFITVAGKFRFPHLVVPDTKFNKSEFKVDLVLDPNDPDQAEFIERMRALDEEGYQAELKAQKKKTLTRRDIVKDETDKEGEETGMVYISAKAASEGKDRKTGEVYKRTVKLFNTKGQDVTGNVPRIWGGTVGKLALQPRYNKSPVGYGLTFYLNAAQIIDLVAGDGSGGKSADDYGFGEEEGGFTSNGEATASEAVDADDDEDDVPF